jgi:peptidoglycan/xylan/chitin deacetylase (PgdA/CDA1 family)
MKPPSLPHRRTSNRFAVLSLLPLGVTLLAAGCAAPVPRAPATEPIVHAEPGPVVARDDEFAVVVVRSGEDLASLAGRYLGDPARAWQIAEFNDVARVEPGQVIVVPLRQGNPMGVHVNGYQTVPILCYHRFGARASKLTVTAAAFEAQMEYLARNGYRVISLQELAGFLDAKQPLPRKSVVITIDDGYRASYEVAFPILKKHRFPATVFLYSDFVGASDAMTWAQMKEMTASGLVDIQPHSKTHSNLTLRAPGETDARYRERVRREVDAPIGAIRERLTEASFTFAYPYGDVNDVVIGELARAGVKQGVTVTPGGNGFFAYPYTLRRSMVFGNEDLDAFKAKLVTFNRMPPR